MYRHPLSQSWLLLHCGVKKALFRGSLRRDYLYVMILCTPISSSKICISIFFIWYFSTFLVFFSPPAIKRSQDISRTLMFDTQKFSPAESYGGMNHSGEQIQITEPSIEMVKYEVYCKKWCYCYINCLKVKL